jgi:hypothetical protein
LAVTWGWVEKAVPKVAVDDGAVEKEELAATAPTFQDKVMLPAVPPPPVPPPAPPPPLVKVGLGM